MRSAASAAIFLSLEFLAQRVPRHPPQQHALSGLSQRPHTIGTLLAAWACMVAMQMARTCIAASVVVAVSKTSTVQGLMSASSRCYRRCRTSGTRSAMMGCWVVRPMAFTPSADSVASDPSSQCLALSRQHHRVTNATGRSMGSRPCRTSGMNPARWVCWAAGRTASMALAASVALVCSARSLALKASATPRPGATTCGAEAPRDEPILLIFVLSVAQTVSRRRAASATSAR